MSIYKIWLPPVSWMKAYCASSPVTPGAVAVLAAPIDVIPSHRDDPGYDDDFQRIREEVNKISGVDTELICQLAEKLLTQTCKDLRVITFYVWARLQRDGETGLAEGVTLLAAMLERFGAMLHPQRERSCKSALEWLGSRRMSDSLSLYPEVDMTTMQVIIRALLLAEAGRLKHLAPIFPGYIRYWRTAWCKAAEPTVWCRRPAAKNTICYPNIRTPHR
jgi:type VI secretion system protein VasJ